MPNVVELDVAQPGDLEIMRLEEILRAVDPRRDVLANERHDGRRDAGHEHEFVERHAQRRILDQLNDRIPGVETGGEAVGLRDLAQPVERCETAGAAHVLEHDGRVAGNVFGQVAREQAPFDVGRTTRRVVVHHRDGLALVEGLALSRRRRCPAECDEAERCRGRGDPVFHTQHLSTSAGSLSKACRSESLPHARVPRRFGAERRRELGITLRDLPPRRGRAERAPRRSPGREFHTG